MRNLLIAGALAPLAMLAAAPGVSAREGGPAFDAVPGSVLGLASVHFEAALPAVAPAAQGFGLAWAAMAVLAAALLYALIAAVATALGYAAPVLPSWTEKLIPPLVIAGLGVAIYLTYVESSGAPAVCGPVGDCNAVQSSRYAMLFGVLPVGLLGAVGYAAIGAAWVVERAGRGPLARLAPLALFGMALFGVLFSVYLTYLELFIVRAVCIWCVTSALLMALVLVLSVGPAVRGFSGDEDA